ncbi:acyltransferase [Brevibacterium album]|uniref:acyltransferase n=1 Tax=Brevibacterium album TaxID=417948 RepID=UPI00048C4AAE|nr:acyltransferase [Brevibacterium album]
MTHRRHLPPDAERGARTTGAAQAHSPPEGCASHREPRPVREAPTRPCPSRPTPSRGSPAAGAYRGDVDLLRLTACLTVMLGHAGGTLIRRARDEHPESAALLVGHLAEAVNPWAVPMFFAVAGWAVLAGAPPTGEATMVRRIVRHAVPLAFWSLAYLLVHKLLDWDRTDLRGTLAQLPFSAAGPGYHLWYLYLYIPLIAVFGAAVLVVRGGRPWRLAALGLLFSAGPVLFEVAQSTVTGDLGGWRWGLTTYAVVYFVGGGLLIHAAETLQLRPWAHWATGLVFVAAAGAVFLWETRIHYPIENANPLTAFLGVCVVLLASALWRRFGERPGARGGTGPRGTEGSEGRTGTGGGKAPGSGTGAAAAQPPSRRVTRLRTLAGASFGAFLVHVLLIDAVFGALFPLELGFAATAVLFVCLWLGCFAVSLAASLLWGRVPGARRLLG